MTRNGLLVAATLLILAAIGFNSYVSLHDHDSLQSFVQAESEQRVHTIGERCEMTDHISKLIQHNLPPSRQSEGVWFKNSATRCRSSLAKVEGRAGVSYKASP